MPLFAFLFIIYILEVSYRKYQEEEALKRTATQVFSVKREDFKTIRAITETAIKKLILQHLDPEGKLDAKNDIIVHRRTEGAYHHCAMILVTDHGSFVVRIPAIGIEAVWQEGDAWNMRSEVCTMKYIRDNTSVPVPKVFAWDNTLNNTISAPYILMETVSGTQALRGLWFKTDENGVANAGENDFPSPELERKRCHFLKSLASIMAELNKLSFDKIGMLTFDEDPTKPEIVHSY